MTSPAPSPSATEPSRCPLCAADVPGREVARIPYAAIWEALAAEWEARPSADVVARHTPGPAAFLRECARCGLQYFEPARGGDRELYDALAATPRYYRPWKWEFGWVRDRIRPGAAVLDIGCGAGDFLAALASRAGRAVGLEQSGAAAAAARARGIEVSEEPLERFADTHCRAFDAVCLFHVLEHLDAVRPFLSPLLGCLRPGGSLFLSVPNRARSFRRPLEPLDCPPHHLSRWSSRQIAWLAGTLGLRVGELACEPVDVTMLRGEVPTRLRARLQALPVLGPALGRWSQRILVRTLLHEGLCGLYSRTGFFDRLGMRGLSLAAWCILPEEGR